MPLISELRLGQSVRGLRVTLHLPTPTATKPAPSAAALSSTRTVLSKAAKQRRAKANAQQQQQQQQQPMTARDPVLLKASSSSSTRCGLSDLSGSIVAEMATSALCQANFIGQQTASSAAVRVAGELQLVNGRLIFIVSEVEHDVAAKSPSAESQRAVELSALLNGRSNVELGAGVWLLRMVAGELFVLLRPEQPDPDSRAYPPHCKLHEGKAHLPLMHDEQALQQCARRALESFTTVRPEQYVLLPTVRSAPFLHCPEEDGAAAAQGEGEDDDDDRDDEPSSSRNCSDPTASPTLVQSVMFCALLLPGCELAGDAAEESTFEREHWMHLARAMHGGGMPNAWVEALTQTISALGGWVNRWIRLAEAEASAQRQQGLAAGSGAGKGKGRGGKKTLKAAAVNDEDSEEENGEESLFDAQGFVLPCTITEQAAEASATATAGSTCNGSSSASSPADAMSDATSHSEAATVPAVLPFSLLCAPGGGAASSQAPRHARRLVAELHAALDKCEATLQTLQDQEPDEEEEEEEEDEDADMDDAGAPAATSARRGGAAPTSAAKLVNGASKAAPTPAVVDDAKVRRLRASIRTVLSQVENGVRPRLPVCILTGFLGSGKTTLLNHLLTSQHGLRIGVVVNDFSNVNVDAGLLHAARPEQLVELSNGCICCTLRADLFGSVVELVASGKVDCIVVESTGLGEPAPVAATFTFELDEENAQAMQSYGLQSLQQIVELDCIATVVDCHAVHQALVSRMQNAEQLTKAQTAAAAAAAAPTAVITGAGGKRNKAGAVVTTFTSAASTPISQAAAALSSIRSSEASSKSVQTLLMEQLEFCNVLVLNKTDLLTPAQVQLVEEFVRLNNCHALCIRTQYGRLDPKLILHSNKFQQQQSLDSPLLAFAAAEWHATLQAARQNPAAAIHGEAAEFGISSFVYTRRVGFSADRFHKLLAAFAASSPGTVTAAFRGVVRVKGVFWLGEAHAAVGVWQSTTPGSSVNVTHAGGWLLTLSAADCVTSGNELLSLASRWHPRVQDRYTQLVLIGAGMDEAAIRQQLDACALTEREMEEALGDGHREIDAEDIRGGQQQQQQQQHEMAALKQKQRASWPLLQKVLDFDADPNAEPTCALKP